MTPLPDLEIDLDERFQRREWHVQRAAWVLWAAVIAAGLSGVLGSGPLSSTTSAADDQSLTVAYDRFLHYHHPTRLELVLAQGVGDEPRVTLSRELLDAVRISSIEPPPVRTELADAGVAYIFRGDVTAGAKIVYFLEYETLGPCGGTIQLAGRSPAVIRQFVYP
ncbi:MAG TPA: hypothetical protein VEQ85_01215 [Lacipirellulaceae bacterium]|nr:hypothetical protein [Lacipirellulaceae bacterium]